MLLLEWLVARHRKPQVYSLPETVSNLSAGMMSQLIGIFYRLPVLLLYIFLFENYALVNNMPLYISFPLGFIMQDFLFYWAHRLSHTSRFLWAGHAIHHHPERMNFSVALRQSGVHGLFTWVFFMPMALTGIQPEVFLAAGGFNLLYQFWLHTELVDRIPVLDRVFNMPTYHRVHHGTDNEYIDRNMAGTLIIWDKLFNTFTEEKRRPVYGVKPAFRSVNALWANFYLYFSYFTALFKPGENPEDTDTVEQIMPDNCESPGITYVLSWLFLSAAGTAAFFLFYEKLSLIQQLLAAGFLILTLLSNSLLLAGNRAGRRLEAARLCTILLLI